MMVFSTIISKINDEKLKQFLLMPRIDYINDLMKLFPKNPYKNKIRIIIEEIPIYSISHIKNYLNKLIMYYKYDLLSPIININNSKHQFQFSQVALSNGIPYELLSYHKSTPYNNFIKSPFIYKDYKFDTVENNEESNLPTLLSKNLSSKKMMRLQPFYKSSMKKRSIMYRSVIFGIAGHVKLKS